MISWKQYSWQDREHFLQLRDFPFAPFPLIWISFGNHCSDCRHYRSFWLLQHYISGIIEYILFLLLKFNIFLKVTHVVAFISSLFFFMLSTVPLYKYDTVHLYNFLWMDISAVFSVSLLWISCCKHSCMRFLWTYFLLE